MQKSIAPFSLLSLALVACATTRATPQAVGPAGKRLTLEQTVGRGEGVDFRGELPDYRWAEDGVHLERGKGEERVLIEPATWTETAAPDEDEPGDEARPGRGARTGDDDSEDEALFGGPAENVRYSSDRERVAFVQDNDLFVVDVATRERRALTSDGGPDVFNGKLDWVYQEEIYGRRNFQAFWWSPDDAWIAFLRLDETDVHDFTVIDHIEEGHFRVKPEITRYPKVGDPNPTVRLGLAAAGAPSDVRWVDLSGYEGTEPLVVRVGWTPDATRLVFMVQDRLQTWLDLVFADPETLRAERVLRETSDSWVERPSEPYWLSDGSFLWESHRTGQQHLYHYARDGELLGAVTSGDWSVRRVDEIDEERGLVWFSATKDGAVSSNTYRIALDGTGLVRLTRGDGSHSVRWNEARTLFLDTVSSLDSPPELLLCDGDGEVVRELGRASIPDLAEYLTGVWEVHEVPARDGLELDVAVLKPVPFDPSASYPVWIPTYSGPDAPSVRNSWEPGARAWNHFLAQNGVVVMQVNVRSASGKGHATTSTAYQRLGIQELMDLEDAVDWITANPWADAQRVGITGGSYGGFMSALALTHSKKFALAYAQSGVYDWAMYDTIYTERYMKTPALNPEGYAATSVIGAAANLTGHLVITHGLMDDNVHFQNAAQLVYALQKAGKDFELMVYPQQRHGIRDRDLSWFDRQRMWRAIQQHLLAPAGPEKVEI